jgi:hypothetical protein
MSLFDLPVKHTLIQPWPFHVNQMLFVDIEVLGL